jgi:hypothetical protein
MNTDNAHDVLEKGITPMSVPVKHQITRTSPKEIETLPATCWRPWRYKPRPALYLDAVSGKGMTNDGTPFTCPPQLSLSLLVEALPPEIATVYLCGKLPEASQVRTEGGELYGAFNSWIVEGQPEQVYLSSGTNHDETLAIVRRTDGQGVDVRTIACWLSTNTCTPQEAYTALALVTEHLRSQNRWQDVCLLKTPARTGLELWHSSIGADPKSGYQHSLAYPVLPEDVRTLIHRTSGQGRFELLPPVMPDGLAPALWYLDGRLTYGGTALGELGIGPATHDHLPEYAGYQPGRYRVEFRVPDGWKHVGLLMAPLPLTGRWGDQRWHFPRTPGETSETWADASEMRIAFAPFPHTCQDCAAHYGANDGSRCPLHGWHLHIQERILFTKGHKPLRAWAEKLIAARDACAQNDLARAAIRNILLHAIGAFHGTHRPVTHIAHAADVPIHTPTQVALSPDGDELHLWNESGITPRFPDYSRPEWSSQIWAKTRARLLLFRDYDSKQFTGALTLPYEQLVAFRLDALYVTKNPGWPDSGRPGTLRVKGHLDGPVPWLREETDLAAIKAQLEEGK